MTQKEQTFAIMRCNKYKQPDSVPSDHLIHKIRKSKKFFLQVRASFRPETRANWIIQSRHQFYSNTVDKKQKIAAIPISSNCNISATPSDQARAGLQNEYHHACVRRPSSRSPNTTYRYPWCNAVHCWLDAFYCAWSTLIEGHWKCFSPILTTPSLSPSSR